MKFHILLLQIVQREPTDLTGNPTTSDWLEHVLSEFNRLSIEVKETLEKSVAYMVDLVSHPLSNYL